MKKKKELNYFDEFINEGKYSVQCSKLLLEVLKNFNKSKNEENIKLIHEIEHNADVSKHEMLKYLFKDFLPPIEREDIINISHRIDNITDLTEEVLINIDIFNIDKVKTETIECAELLLDICNNVVELLEEFKSFKKSHTIKDKIIKINGMEEQGDVLYAKYMKQLYKNERDSITISIWSTIFNCFEDCFDACESVADYVESIIIKNS